MQFLAMAYDAFSVSFILTISTYADVIRNGSIFNF